MNKEIPSVILLGSTGSIGTQALMLADAGKMKINALSAGKNVELAEKQVRRFMPALCAMADADAAKDLRVRLADTSVRVLSGEDGICRLIEEAEATTVINAITGSAGLRPTLRAIDCRKTLALANKESLVMAGKTVMERAAENRVEVRPVDSEHSAIWQCLKAGRRGEVSHLILTASGGPFFGYTREMLGNVTLAQTLAHPTWKMGKSITVDSATLMNKGFEVIEASYLFGIDADNIDVTVHRESIIHSMVEYIDNSVIAQMSLPDMRMCINYALSYPERTSGLTPRLDLTEIGKLTFFKPDTNAFPLLALAYSAIKSGGAVPAILHAANEVAVTAFLNEKIRFCDIPELVEKTVLSLSAYSGCTGTDEIFEADIEARHTTERYISGV